MQDTSYPAAGEAQAARTSKLDESNEIRSETPSLGHRLRRALGPVLPGLVIDGVDLITFGPAGLWLGPLIGGPAGWFLARQLGLGRGHSAALAVLAGVYCALPFTTALPLATMIGAWARFVMAGEPASGEHEGP